MNERLIGDLIGYVESELVLLKQNLGNRKVSMMHTEKICKIAREIDYEIWHAYHTSGVPYVTQRVAS